MPRSRESRSHGRDAFHQICNLVLFLQNAAGAFDQHKVTAGGPGDDVDGILKESVSAYLADSEAHCPKGASNTILKVAGLPPLLVLIVRKQCFGDP